MQNPFNFIKNLIDKMRAQPAPINTSEQTAAPAKKIPASTPPPSNEEKQAALERFISTTPDETYEAVIDAGSQLIEAMHPKK